MKGHFPSKYQQQLVTFVKFNFPCEFSAVEWCQIRPIDVMVSQAVPQDGPQDGRLSPF